MKPKFIPNNLNFRLFSAKAREAYSNSQAFALSQLLDNPKHEFSVTAKEILLLKYDMWLKWLCDVEQLLRREKVATKEIVEAIIYGSNKVQREYFDIIKDNPEHFDAEYAKVWIKSHSSLYDLLIEDIRSKEYSSITQLITAVADTLIMVMDATLFELHEIDTIMYGANGKHTFVSVSDVCFKFIELFPDRCMLAERLDIYKEHGANIDSLIVKDYTTKDIQPILNKLTEYGYNIKEVV